MKSRPASSSATLVIQSSWGDLKVEVRCGAIIACALPFVEGEREAPRLLGAKLMVESPADRATLVASEQFIRQLFAGKKARRPRVELPPATAFVQSIWRALMDIPHGETRSYGELATIVGHAGAARAAGSACGANQIPLFVPCHRVLGSGGALGGFSSGLAWKPFLLRCEGVEL